MVTTATMILTAAALLGLSPDQKNIPPVEQCEAIDISTSSLSWMLTILPDGSGTLIYGSIDAAGVRKGTFDFERIHKKTAKIGLTRDEAKARREERGEQRQPMSGFRFTPKQQKQKDETSRPLLYVDDDQFVAGLFETAHKNLTRDWRFDMLFLLYPPTADTWEWSRPSLNGKEPLPEPGEFRQIGIYTQGGWQIQIRRNGSGFLAFGRPGFEAAFPKKTFDFDETYRKLIVNVGEFERLNSRNEVPRWTSHYVVGLQRPKRNMKFAFYCPDRDLLRQIFDRGKEAATEFSTLEEYSPKKFDEAWQSRYPVPIEKEDEAKEK